MSNMKENKTYKTPKESIQYKKMEELVRLIAASKRSKESNKLKESNLFKS